MTTMTETEPRPYKDSDDALLLERIATLRSEITDAYRLLYEAEKEAERRMAERGATSIPSELFVCELVTEVNYDRTRFTPLKMLFNESDLAECLTPGFQEIQTVPESWNTARVKAMAKKYGDQALSVVEAAKMMGRPRLKFEKRG